MSNNTTIAATNNNNNSNEQIQFDNNEQVQYNKDGTVEMEPIYHIAYIDQFVYDSNLQYIYDVIALLESAITVITY